MRPVQAVTMFALLGAWVALIVFAYPIALVLGFWIGCYTVGRHSGTVAERLFPDDDA